MNKTDTHKELNEAYAKILSIAYTIGISSGSIDHIRQTREFMSQMIDINLQNVEVIKNPLED